MAATPTTQDKATLVAHNEQNENFGGGNVVTPNKKSLVVAYMLWFPFGILGFHRLYLCHWFMGPVYMFTLGYFGIGWLVDCYFLPQMVREYNIQVEYDATHPEELKQPAPCKYHKLYYRSVRDAYILTLSPLGYCGLQHAYLGQHWYRFAYSVTFGLFGFGWFTDIFRMRSLVMKTNEEIGNLRRGVSMEELKRSDASDCTTLQAYLFAIPGFFGFHRFYLGEWKLGITYFFTLGLCGIGWLVDLIRMPHLVERSNLERKEDTRNTKHLDDAYLLACPLGIFGAHHFYLNRPRWGILYLFTLGLFGIGWLIDFARMPSLVREANLRNKQGVAIIPANAHHPAYVIPVQANTNAYVFTQSGSYNYPRNSAYPNLPPQNGQYPTAPPPYLQYDSNHPAAYQYQSGDNPPTYAPTVSNEDQSHRQSQPLKQYPPP